MIIQHPGSTPACALRGLRVLVTGGSGFIGRRLCRALNEGGATVDVVSRGLPDPDVAFDQWWTADLSDEEATLRAISKAQPRIIFHLAGQVAGGRQMDLVGSMLRNNLVSTVNLMTAGVRNGCERFIIAGTMEEPAPSPERIPRSPYAAAKWAATSYAHMYHALYSLPVTILKLFMVYGPEQVDQTKLIPYVIGSLLRREPPRLTDGKRLVDWIYVDDVVHAFLEAASTDRCVGQTIEIGSGRLVAIETVVNRICEMLCSEIRPIFGALPRRPLEHESVADPALAGELLGWNATVPLDVGLRRTVEWYSADHSHGRLHS